MRLHQHEPQSAAAAGSHPEKAGSPRVGDGTRILRATYPAVKESSPSTPTPSANGHLARQAVVTKRLTNTNNAQWRSAGHKTEGDSPNVARLAAPAPDLAEDAHSKRPVSPHPLPLVRRRLAKRSRQDGLGQCPDGQVDEADTGHGHDVPEERVTVERLVTSPDYRGVTAKTPVSQSGLSSLARDLNMLPAISTVVTPRH